MVNPMQSHITRSTTGTFFKKYCLSVRIHADPAEVRVIREHRLEAIEIFADPLRQELENLAQAAHERAIARGLFVVRARDAAAITASEISALVSTVRAAVAFKIQVSDLLRGVTISHSSLRAISDIESVLTTCIDNLDTAVRAATSYANDTEDVFAPGTDAPDPTVPPAQWTRGWR